MNLFRDITTLDISEPLIATLEIIEKAVCSIKKNIEINGENKEFEEVVTDTLEILVLFKDQMVKRQTIFDQEQWSKKPAVNLITDSIIKSEVCITTVFTSYFFIHAFEGKYFKYTVNSSELIIIKVSCS